VVDRPNNSPKVYVGLTVCSLTKRKNEHTADARRGKQTPFHRAIVKYGAGSVSWHVLTDNVHIEVARQTETEAIAFFDSTSHARGYNVAPGGICGAMWSEELRKKKSTEMLRRWGTDRAGMLSCRSPWTPERRQAQAQRQLRPATIAKHVLQRGLSPAQTTNVRFLISLGALQKDCALWFGVSKQTITNVKQRNRRAYL
jgi:hypothetical protein